VAETNGDAKYVNGNAKTTHAEVIAESGYVKPSTGGVDDVKTSVLGSEKTAIENTGAA
jgi:hypothetical protein